ncbi:MAG: hypothetical protein V1743_04260 [Nanoarchaeota archaeon]
MIVTPAVKDAFLKLANAARDLPPLPTQEPAKEIMFHEVPALQQKSRLDISLSHPAFNAEERMRAAQEQEKANDLTNAQEERAAIIQITQALEERLDRIQSRKVLPEQRQDSSFDQKIMDSRKREQLTFLKNRILLYELKSELAGVEKIFAELRQKRMLTASIEKVFSKRIENLYKTIAKKMQETAS